MVFKKNPLIRSKPRNKSIPQPNKSAGILDDFAIRKNVATKEGTIEKVPVNDSDIANKKYVDDNAGGVSDHALLTNVTANQHHAQSHNMASHSDDDTYNISTTGTANIGTNTLSVNEVSGNVGIGTNSPTEKLNIIGTEPRILIEGDTNSGVSGIDFNSLTNVGASAIGSIQSSWSGFGMKFILPRNVGTHGYWFQNHTANTLMFIDSSSGNVGISTNVPKNRLDIEGNLAVGNSYSGTSTAPTNGVIIEGNVGIGTASPNYKLDVAGTTNITGALTGGGSGHDQFSDYVANEHIDWTTDQGATNINAGNYTDTDTTAHASFSQLDYASAGHTGFAPALGADDNYVTDTEKAALHAIYTDASAVSAVATADDYLKNDASDTTSGTITAAGFTTTGVTLTGDHGTAATDQVVNVCYGTGTAPTANTTTEGALFVKYTA